MSEVNVWSYIKSINEKQEIDNDHIKEYTPWIVNRSLGSFPELLYHVEQMNLRANLSKEMQYAYYFNAVPKAKRFKKWIKTNEKSSNYKYILRVSEYLNCSIRKAEIAWDIMSDAQKQKVKDMISSNELKNTPQKK
jgi:hypothetical protein